MRLDHLATVKATVEQYGLMAKKSLGQNFLFNMDIVRKIARTAGCLKEVTVLEIGPGPGGLTRALLEAGAQEVVAIEHDPRCIIALKELVEAAEGKLQVIHADALTLSPQDLIPNRPIKIVANLPYNVGTQLLIRWLHCLDNIMSMTLMFQKEVALRIVAQPKTADYGRLTVLAQYLTQPTKVFDLPPGAFSPPPKVKSSIVHLVPKVLSEQELALLPYLEKITHAAFGQRRKMVRSSLNVVLTEDQIQAAKVATTARAEELSLENYIGLAKMLKDAAPQR